MFPGVTTTTQGKSSGWAATSLPLDLQGLSSSDAHPFDLSSKVAPVSSYSTVGIAIRCTGVLKPSHHD